ncbi:MAG TPA: hypothetical protein DDY13_01415 [Cytophagales bacterium]|jgi:hypothetical protein|nr:hypothetical protein [Cytophagales bacterium]
MIRKKSVFLIFIFTITGTYSVVGQSGDYQIWTDFTIKYESTNRIGLGGDVGYRTEPGSGDWNTFYIRPTVYYAPNNIFKLNGGLAYFKVFQDFPQNSDEIRLFQDFHFNWPDFGWLLIRNRIRFEERFFFFPDGDDDFSARGRYRINLESRDFGLFGSARKLYLVGSWEGFLQLNQAVEELFINNYRTYISLGLRQSAGWRYELHFMQQNSRQIVEDGFKTQEYVVRFRVFHTILNEIENEKTFP